ncbi:acyltransferase [Treponema sp. TIM-1]
MVLLVVVYHVFYLFNSVGVPKNIGDTGIPAFDGFCYFIYPWLMTIMFLVAGISARYALQSRSEKQFAKERIQKLLIPLAGGMFLLAWINGWVANQYVDVFEGNDIPAFMKYLILCLVIGPLWFNLELFFVSMVLIIIRKIDRRDRLWTLAGKTNVLVLLLLALPLWGSSFLLNIVITFRNGIYLFVFLTGYYFFSQDKIIGILTRFRFPLLVSSIILGIIEVYVFYGKSFVADNYLQHPLINLYAWVMMMALLGYSHQYLNQTNKAMEYIKSRSFFWYLTHFPIMSFAAYIIMSKFKFPMICNYILLLFFGFGITVIVCEMVRLIPVLRFLLFGIRNKSREA